MSNLSYFLLGLNLGLAVAIACIVVLKRRLARAERPDPAEIAMWIELVDAQDEALERSLLLSQGLYRRAKTAEAHLDAERAA